MYKRANLYTTWVGPVSLNTPEIILSRPRGWAFAYPGATRGHLKYMFSKVPWMISSGVEQWLVCQGHEKLVGVFKGMFSQF